MKKISNNIKQIIPFPYFDEKGVPHNGLLYSIPDICKKCNYKCSQNGEDARKINVCHKGLNYYFAKFQTYTIVLFGFIIQEYKGKLPRKKKKELNESFHSIYQIQAWEKNVVELIENIIEFKDRKVKDNFSLFHDIIPTISMIFRTVESIINTVDGNSFEEKVENADYKLQTLYHSIDLLDNRLKIMPLIANPESAKFGQVNKCSPYKIFDKVHRLFKETALRKGVRINLDSNKYITFEPVVYDSFMTLPFLLVENAIKYSLNNNHVDIQFTQNKNSLKISVLSYGPIVQDENVSRIFEKGFKDPNAQKFSSKGSGIGLYLANIVAKAHNIEIEYSNQKGGTDQNGINLGVNEFSIILRK